MIDLNTIIDGTTVTYNGNEYRYFLCKFENEYGSIMFRGLFSPDRGRCPGEERYIVVPGGRDPFEDCDDKTVYSQEVSKKINIDDLALHVSICGEKYTVQQSHEGELNVLRFGEQWRECTGDNLIYSLAAEIQELRDKIKEARSHLDYEFANNSYEACCEAFKVLK
jgi:hypothetical protein